MFAGKFSDTNDRMKIIDNLADFPVYGSLWDTMITLRNIDDYEVIIFETLNEERKRRCIYP